MVFGVFQYDPTLLNEVFKLKDWSIRSSFSNISVLTPKNSMSEISQVSDFVDIVITPNGSESNDDKVVASLRMGLPQQIGNMTFSTDTTPNIKVTKISQKSKEKQKYPTQDPFLSWSLTHFDASTGEIVIGGSNATFNSGTPSELPNIDAITNQDGFVDDDPLLGALLDYSGIFLEGENIDGTFSFTDGLLSALNPLNPSDILFSADIVDVLANPNPNNLMFSAKLQNFVAGSVSPESSPLLAELVLAGTAELWLDPVIIELTESDNKPFSQTGTTSMLYLQDGTPVPVSEPTSTLSFLALGTLGAASTLKRKLKSSQSSVKETTKLG